VDTNGANVRVNPSKRLKLMTDTNIDRQAEQAAALGLQQGNVSDQYLSFLLGGEEYAVSILSVQEIKTGESLTPIPKTPDYIRGVMNLRGVIVPVVDLRSRFQISAERPHEIEVVILLNIQGPDRKRMIGAIVDDVIDVYSVPAEELKPAPDFGSAISTRFLRGIATLSDRILLMLDSERLFSLEELNRLDDLEPAEQER